MAPKINLRDFYSWYKQDEFVEVSDETETELLADKRYNKTHERTMRRNKVFSLDAEDGTEAQAVTCQTDNPEAIFTMLENHYRLRQALSSLSEIQGRRIVAHFMLGISRKEIAQAEGVSESAITKGINRGLRTMKENIEKNL